MVYAKSSNSRESFPRDWLILSETKRSLHFLPCVLFNTNLTETSNATCTHLLGLLGKIEGFFIFTKHRENFFI